MTGNRQPSGNHHYYISGAGTLDRRSGIKGPVYDGGTGESMPDRIARLADDFFDHVAWMYSNRKANMALNVDIVGFSRGAASARIFANLMGSFLEGDDYFILDRDSGRRADFTLGDPRFARDYLKSACINVSLRFLGLWDTVPHYYVNQNDDLNQLDLTIHPDVKHVAHAVAVNEDRKDFHGVSIHTHAQPTMGLNTPPTPNINTESRMELGFIGAHSDIGGGYSEGDLSDVAFMWMVQRAEKAGVTMDRAFIEAPGQSWNVANTPVLHDSVGITPTWLPYDFNPARRFKYMNDIDEPLQKDWSGYGMDYRTSQDGFYDSRYTIKGTKGLDYSGDRTRVGIVDGAKYSQWLSDNYQLNMEINAAKLRRDGQPPPARP